VLTLKLTAFFVVLLTISTAQTQEPKFRRVQFSTADSIPSAIHFFCSQGFDQDECLRDAAALRQSLAPYPLQLLGEWSFYLVLTPDWKPLAVSHGGPAVSPAFSLLLGRATVMDRCLFTCSADRKAELQKWSGIPWGPSLVDVAISHELGHALCQEKNEGLANKYGKDLRDGKIPQCKNAAALKGARASK
jgi:hypothetical protein